MFAYVGCRTTVERRARGKGIGVYAIASDGGWDHLQTAAALDNPSFLALAPDGDRLYAVHGDTEWVSAFEICRDGTLELLGTQSTGGRNPVHLAIQEPSRSLIVANYASGSIARLPLDADGRIGPLTELLDLPGEPGPHRLQQRGSHPHHILLDPTGGRLIVPDKGLDRVFVAEVTSALVLAPHQPPSGREGSGPRHAVFHPSGLALFVANELDATVTSHRYDAETAELFPREIVSVLPPDCLRTSHAAGIALTPCGRWLFVSNRGHDSVTTLRVDADSFTVQPVAWTPSGGAKPRFIGLDPSGNRLVVANEDGDSIVVFLIDGTSGALTPTGVVVETGSPVCVAFAEERA